MFFQSALGTYLSSSFASAATKQGSEQVLSPAEFATFSAYVDTIIPADEYTPAPSGLNIPAEMLTRARRLRTYQRLLRLGCRWLDQSARAAGGERFANLDDSRREKIVEQTARPDAEKLPAVLYRVVRIHSMTLYYSRAAGWTGLNYNGPPQPDGFMDYAQPPKRRAR